MTVTSRSLRGLSATVAVVLLGALAGPALAQGDVELTTTAPRLEGSGASGQAGWDVATIGDMNGDGLEDLAVSANVATYSSRSGAGAVYVVYGRSDLGPLTLGDSMATDEGFAIYGESAGDNFGAVVSAAGDINGDGYADLAASSPLRSDHGRGGQGTVYVIYGGLALENIDLASFAPDSGFLIDGASSTDYLSSIAAPGDISGDDCDDLAVGSAYADDNSRIDSGSVYIVYGCGSSSADVDLHSFASSQGLTIEGALARDNTGMALSAAGDVNADGRGDLIIGARGADNNGRVTSGSAYIFYGSAATQYVDLASAGEFHAERGLRIDGAATGDYTGNIVSGVGDTNADGYADVAVGAYGTDNNGRSFSGSVYIIYGAVGGSTSGTPVIATTDLASLTSSQGMRIDGAEASSYLGSSPVATEAGDINGDGFADVVIGSENEDSVYVVYGHFSGNVDLSALGEGGYRLYGDVGESVGKSVAVSDLNDDGLRDVIVGAPEASPGNIASAGLAYMALSTNPVDTSGDDPGTDPGTENPGSEDTVSTQSTTTTATTQTTSTATSISAPTLKLRWPPASSARISRKAKSLTIYAKVDQAPAKVSIKAKVRYRGKSITIAKGSRSFSKSGTRSVKLKLTKKGRSFLRHVRRGKKFKVTFTGSVKNTSTGLAGKTTRLSKRFKIGKSSSSVRLT